MTKVAGGNPRPPALSDNPEWSDFNLLESLIKVYLKVSGWQGQPLIPITYWEVQRLAGKRIFNNTRIAERLF